MNLDCMDSTTHSVLICQSFVNQSTTLDCQEGKTRASRRRQVLRQWIMTHRNSNIKIAVLLQSTTVTWSNKTYPRYDRRLKKISLWAQPSKHRGTAHLQIRACSFGCLLYFESMLRKACASLEARAVAKRLWNTHNFPSLEDLQVLTRR